MYMDIYRALSTAACGLCLGRGGAGPAAGGGVGGPEACLAAGGGPGSLPPIPKVLPRAPAARREVPTPGGAGPCPLPLPGRSVPAAGGAVTALPGRGMALVTVRRAPGSAGVSPVVSAAGSRRERAGSAVERGGSEGAARSGWGSPRCRRRPPTRERFTRGNGVETPPELPGALGRQRNPPCRARAANGGGFASCPSRRQVGRAHSPRRALQEDDAPRRGHLQRR